MLATGDVTHIQGTNASGLASEGSKAISSAAHQLANLQLRIVHGSFTDEFSIYHKLHYLQCINALLAGKLWLTQAWQEQINALKLSLKAIQISVDKRKRLSKIFKQREAKAEESGTVTTEHAEPPSPTNIFNNNQIIYTTASQSYN